MKNLLLLLLLSSPSFAFVPQYKYDDPHLNDELSSIYKSINEVGNGTYKSSSMTIQGITVDSITVNSGIRGTTTNNNAGTGFVGEYISAKQIVDVNAAGNGIFTDIAAITLTPGDWDISGVAFTYLGTAPAVPRFQMALSINSGNTVTDHQAGDNLTDGTGPTTQVNIVHSIPAWRKSLSATTNIYLKGADYYSSGTPAMQGRISARRVR